MLAKIIKLQLKKNSQETERYGFLATIHLDGVLLALLLLLSCSGLLILYSATSENIKVVQFQAARFLFAFILLFLVAQIPPISLRRIAPWFYGISLCLLILVLFVGHWGKGAERWLNLGLFKLQPAELMKLAIPMLLAWYYHKKRLPIQLPTVLLGLIIILVPAFLTAKQPDLGTALILIFAGISVLFLAGLSSQIIFTGFFILAACVPFSWYFLHDYQRQRVLTFLNPERSPLGAGYHIIQSKIAIGSGGLFGKGWLHGTQSNLHFLPEHATDFIFAVCGEELGFVGVTLIILLYFTIVLCGLYITVHAQDTFSRLLAGSITFTFFASFFINMGMVTGMLPVVGVPLPLISYGGSSMMTFLVSFGMLMSIQTHRKLVTT